MIKNLHREGGMWCWHNSNDDRGVYYTNNNGEGIFYQSEKTGMTKQILGTAQFSACDTESGMRRKLNKLFDEQFEDNRI